MKADDLLIKMIKGKKSTLDKLKISDNEKLELIAEAIVDLLILSKNSKLN